MKNARSILLALAALAAACATNPAPPPTTTPAPAPPPPTTLDSADMRKALEHAFDQITAHEQTPVASPRVDVEAAVSIPIPDQETVRGALAYFTTDLKADIQESLTRSAQYKKLIDRVLDESKLPRGLAYLPVIESAYMPTLTSRAGAHGIWQFMPETAREYGLRVDWWVDERADPDRSTRAAAAYLRDLYADFGDWPLALAAYNAGPGRIHRALDRTGSSTFWDLVNTTAIPRETRGYVPTFFAALIIAADPATYGFTLADSVEPDVQRVNVAGPVSLRYMAEAANVDEALLRELNPSLRHGIVPPGGSAVRLPKPAAALIAARAATLKDEDATVAVCAYTARGGDTIQRLARTLGTKSGTILAMNGLSRSHRLRRGESIYLPVRARELSNLLREAQMYYAVRKGDTLTSIARRHDLSLAELCELNQFSPRHTLHPGDKIRVAVPHALSAGGL